MFIFDKIPRLGSKRITCKETGLELELRVQVDEYQIISSYDGQVDTTHICTKEWLKSLYLLLDEKP